jgi:hypothetical protein
LIADTVLVPVFWSPKYAVALLTPFAKLTSSEGAPAAPFDAEK